jgi:cephalosporin-C deacetylase
MALFDLPLDELKKYAPEIPEPADFDAFWRKTVAASASRSIDATYESLADDIHQTIDVDDVTFSGFDGHRIRAWFLRPAGVESPLPCVVSFVGYGGGRSRPIDHVWPCVSGFAHFVMDTRGQGSVWSPGDTPDPYPAGPHVPGFSTRGIESRDSYYYRRLFVDAMCAVEAASNDRRVDRERIAVNGASQGGTLALAAAALSPMRPKLAIVEVPFLCHIRRAVEITDARPFSEIADYLRCHPERTEAVFATLSYFDGCHFAARVRSDCLFSVCLMDQCCPPSTVFAAYNRVEANKDMAIYTFNGHDGGRVHQTVTRMRFLKERL